MLVLAQKEAILKAIIKICIKIHKIVVFFNQSGSNLIRWYIYILQRGRFMIEDRESFGKANGQRQ